MSTLSGSSSQPRNPSNASADEPLPGGDDNADSAADPALWKRRYHALQESVNAQNKSKRKLGSVNLINI